MISVIKVGGDVIAKNQSLDQLTDTIKRLQSLHHQVVIVHGGSPQINTLQSQCGLVPEKIAGRRKTRPEDLNVVIQALCGKANVNLTAALVRKGLPALGIHGASLGLISATKRPPRVIPGAGPDAIDLGCVGDIKDINTTALRTFLNAGMIPVIATLGIDLTKDDQDPWSCLYNINADTSVIAIASQLTADNLIMITEIGGVFKDINDINSRLPVINPELAQQYIENQVIKEGMIVKVDEAFNALKQGVGQVIIIGPDCPLSTLKGLSKPGRALDMGTIITI